MDVKALRGLLSYFEEVPDPRASNVSFSLPSLLAMALLAVLCRCEDYDEIACWAQHRAVWLATFLDLPVDDQGPRTPHADTFERVFRKLRPAGLERVFVAFTQGMAGASPGRHIAIDGKALRGSIDAGGRKAAIHMVHAWDQQNGLVLGQVAVEDKSNEITAVPRLLDLLDVKGAVLSLDALHCQKETASAIRKAGADYLLAVKDNQKTLHEDVRHLFEIAIAQRPQMLVHGVDEPDNSHGRLDERRLWASDEVDMLRNRHKDWKDLRGVVKVQTRRLDFKTGQETVATRHYVTSLDVRKYGAARLLELVRGHWGVENQLHWCLDVCLGDDQSRVRKDYGAQNLAVIRRQALNLLRKNPPQRGKYASPSDKVSLKRRRLICSLNEQFLMETFFQIK